MAGTIEIDASVHEALAKNLFNRVWELLDTEDRTSDQDDEMLNATHASRYHWSKVGSELQLSIGEWQISRVYGVLKRPEPCLYHGQKCFDYAMAGELEPFYIGYAHEALARGHILAGSATSALGHLRLARSLALQVQNEERAWLEKDLDQLESEMHARAE